MVISNSCLFYCRLLNDHDPSIIMKTLGLLRNLVSPRPHTDAIMDIHGLQIMQGIVIVLESPHEPEIKEQALCILGKFFQVFIFCEKNSYINIT